MKIHHNEINFIYSSSLQKKTLTMYITVKTEHIKAKKNTMKCQKCKKKNNHINHSALNILPPLLIVDFHAASLAPRR